MLWYRAWCETRARLAIAAGSLAAVAVASAAYRESVKMLFVMLVIALGGGSLRQERALGTLGFTLALPVRRSRLLAVRAASGQVEVVALALVVGVAVVVGARLTGEPYPVARALALAIQWAVCGGLVLAIALLISALVASEYVAWLVAFVVVMAYEAAVNLTALRRLPVLDLFRIMGGDGDGGALPETAWTSLAVVVVASVVVLALSAQALRREL